MIYLSSFFFFSGGQTFFAFFLLFFAYSHLRAFRGVCLFAYSFFIVCAWVPNRKTLELCRLISGMPTSSLETREAKPHKKRSFSNVLFPFRETKGKRSKDCISPKHAATPVSMTESTHCDLYPIQASFSSRRPGSVAASISDSGTPAHRELYALQASFSSRRPGSVAASISDSGTSAHRELYALQTSFSSRRPGSVAADSATSTPGRLVAASTGPCECEEPLNPLWDNEYDGSEGEDLPIDIDTLNFFKEEYARKETEEKEEEESASLQSSNSSRSSSVVSSIALAQQSRFKSLGGNSAMDEYVCIPSGPDSTAMFVDTEVSHQTARSGSVSRVGTPVLVDYRRDTPPVSALSRAAQRRRPAVVHPFRLLPCSELLAGFFQSLGIFCTSRGYDALHEPNREAGDRSSDPLHREGATEGGWSRLHQNRHVWRMFQRPYFLLCYVSLVFCMMDGAREGNTAGSVSYGQPWRNATWCGLTSTSLHSLPFDSTLGMNATTADTKANPGYAFPVQPLSTEWLQRMPSALNASEWPDSGIAAKRAQETTLDVPELFFFVGRRFRGAATGMCIDSEAAQRRAVAAVVWSPPLKQNTSPSVPIRRGWIQRIWKFITSSPSAWEKTVSPSPSPTKKTTPYHTYATPAALDGCHAAQLSPLLSLLYTMEQRREREVLKTLWKKCLDASAPPQGSSKTKRSSCEELNSGDVHIGNHTFSSKDASTKASTTSLPRSETERTSLEDESTFLFPLSLFLLAASLTLFRDDPSSSTSSLWHPSSLVSRFLCRVFFQKRVLPPEEKPIHTSSTRSSNNNNNVRAARMWCGVLLVGLARFLVWDGIFTMLWLQCTTTVWCLRTIVTWPSSLICRCVAYVLSPALAYRTGFRSTMIRFGHWTGCRMGQRTSCRKSLSVEKPPSAVPVAPCGSLALLHTAPPSAIHEEESFADNAQPPVPPDLLHYFHVASMLEKEEGEKAVSTGVDLDNRAGVWPRIEMVVWALGLLSVAEAILQRWGRHRGYMFVQQEQQRQQQGSGEFTTSVWSAVENVLGWSALLLHVLLKAMVLSWIVFQNWGVEHAPNIQTNTVRTSPEYDEDLVNEEEEVVSAFSAFDLHKGYLVGFGLLTSYVTLPPSLRQALFTQTWLVFRALFQLGATCVLPTVTHSSWRHNSPHPHHKKNLTYDTDRLCTGTADNGSYHWRATTTPLQRGVPVCKWMVWQTQMPLLWCVGPPLLDGFLISLVHFFPSSLQQEVLYGNHTDLTSMASVLSSCGVSFLSSCGTRAARWRESLYEYAVRGVKGGPWMRNSPSAAAKNFSDAARFPQSGEDSTNTSASTIDEYEGTSPLHSAPLVHPVTTAEEKAETWGWQWCRRWQLPVSPEMREGCSARAANASAQPIDSLVWTFPCACVTPASVNDDWTAPASSLTPSSASLTPCSASGYGGVGPAPPSWLSSWRRRHRWWGDLWHLVTCVWAYLWLIVVCEESDFHRLTSLSSDTSRKTVKKNEEEVHTTTTTQMSRRKWRWFPRTTSCSLFQGGLHLVMHATVTQKSFCACGLALIMLLVRYA